MGPPGGGGRGGVEEWLTQFEGGEGKHPRSGAVVQHMQSAEVLHGEQALQAEAGGGVLSCETAAYAFIWGPGDFFLGEAKWREL